MKKLFFVLSMLLVSMIGPAQNFVIHSDFEPMSLEDRLLPFLILSQNSERVQKAQAERRKAAEQRFDENKAYAYQCFNKGDYSGFIHYSAIALNTGWYTAKMYYDRGVAFEAIHNYRQAKKEYKTAIRYGYQPAVAALKQVNAHKRAWKQSQKRVRREAATRDDVYGAGAGIE